MSTLAASPASLSWLALGVVLAAVFLAALVVRAYREMYGDGPEPVLAG
ncbi:MAG TPA: hypothetical protein VMH61_00080 [Candidatus Acidoferrales bacterium]|nr:hypothetical protein [Candidatus Acidoferrales bacterium]